MGCGNSTANTAASHPPAAAAYVAPANGGAPAEQADRTGAPAGAAASAPAASAHEGSQNTAETSQNGSQRRRGDASKRLTLPMGPGGVMGGGGGGGGVGTTALTGLIKDQADRGGDVDTGAISSRRGSRRGSPPGSARRHHHSDGSSGGGGSSDHASSHGGGHADHDSSTQLLVSIPFFESLDKKAIKKLRDAFRRRKYNAGDWVTRASGAAAQAQAQPESTIAHPQPTTPPDAAAPGAAAATTPTAEAAAEDEFFVIISGSVQLSVPVFTSKTAPSLPSAPLTNERPDPLALPGLQVEDVMLAVLKDGQWFGVEALVADSFQRCNVRALDSTVLLSISRQEFRDFSAGVESMSTNIADVVSNTKISLRSLPFFSTIDELKLQQLSQLLEFRRFDTGSVIMREGEPGDGFIVVVTGTANITVQRNQDGGTQHSTFLLSTLNPGDHWGETALLAQGPRVATVTATSPMLCLFLSAQRFKQFGRLAPEVFSEAFNSISKNRTSQLLKTIPLFDVLCLSAPPEPAAHMPLQPMAAADATHATSLTPPPAATASGAPAYDEQKLSLLASLFEYRAFPKDSVVFREGDRADCLYIILRGSVEVSAVVETGVVILNRLGQSEYFVRETHADTKPRVPASEARGLLDFAGEISLLFPTVRSATITTREPCLLLCLAATKFARFLSIAPELRASMEFSIGPRVASIIENIPFFRSEIKENKPWSKLGLLGELCCFEKCEENEVLFRQGDRGDKFYVIVAGAVLVTKTEEPQLSTQMLADDGGQSHVRAGSRDHRLSHVPSATSSVPGVILRRGNYFGDDCLITSKPRWGTVTALALSVFLTLTKANFDKYVKIAPELRELLIKRQQIERAEETEGEEQEAAGAGKAASASSSAATSPFARQQSSRKVGLIAAVASNQSLESSPIFDTHADAEFRPSPSVAAQHPDLHRLATVASTPAPRRTLGLRGGAVVERMPLPAGLAPIAGGSPLDRPALGRPGSLSVNTLGASVLAPPPASGSPTAASSSLSPLGRPARLAQLTPARSTMARFGEGSGVAGAGLESSAQGHALAPISGSSAPKQHRPSVIAKELQAYEAQNVRTS